VTVHRRRLRRARCLIGFWEDGEFVVENYLTRRQVLVSPVVAQLLQQLDEFSTEAEVISRLERIPRAREVVSELVVQELLLVEGSPLEERDTRVAATWKWGHDAQFFHYATQTTVFEGDLVVEAESLARLARAEAAPHPFKDYEGPHVPLPGSFEEFDSDFWSVLRSRRTIRSFVPTPISLHDFSTVVRWTWGATRIMADDVLGNYVVKTSPSGGARHPVEVYPVVLRVEGLSRGFYHYSVRHDSLELLRSGDFDDGLLVDLCARQPWVASSAAVFFMTGAVERMMWKYRQSHAYRVLQLDAGHLGQTFHLVCTKLGLAPFTTAAIDAPAVERELRLDGVSEIALYAAACGRPAEGASHRHDEETGPASAGTS
jgi:SagB-type dehydrogenase family enzyme